MKKAWGMAACLAVAVLTGCAQKQLMLITPYSPDSPRTAELQRAILARFKTEFAPVELRVFHMNTRARPTEVWSEEMGKLAAMHVRAFDPDFVFLAGDDAARYAGRELLNRPYPAAFFDVKGDPADYLFTASANITGVRAAPPVAEMFALIKALLPEARRLAVLGDGSLEGDAAAAAVRTADDKVLSVVAVRRAGSLAEWLAAVRDVQDRADVLILAGYGSVLREPFGQHAVPEAELLTATAQVNRLPVLAFRSPAGTAGPLLGVVDVPLSAQAVQAATIGARVLLYGANVQDILIANSSARAARVDIPLAKQLGIVVPARYRRPSPKPAMPRMNLIERFYGLFKPVRRPVGLQESAPGEAAGHDEEPADAKEPAPRAAEQP